MAAARAEVFRPKAEDTLGLGSALALAAHLLLVAALALGVNWRTHTPEVAEAEIWSEVPLAVAPAAESPPPQPVEETPPPPPPPVAQAEPEPAPEPLAEIPSAPVPKAKPKKDKPVPPVAKVEPKPPKPKKEKPPKEVFEPPVVAKKPPKAVPVPPSTPPTPTLSSAEREAQRKAAMQRMMKDLGTLGTSEHAAGPSAGYIGKLRARIIPNITFLMDEGSGNPTAFVEIRCAPDGTILSRRLLDSSGSPAWDKAVLDGIEKTRSLPLDEKGRLPDTVFQIGISPRDR